MLDCPFSIQNLCHTILHAYKGLQIIILTKETGFRLREDIKTDFPPPQCNKTVDWALVQTAGLVLKIKVMMLDLVK